MYFLPAHDIIYKNQIRCLKEVVTMDLSLGMDIVSYASANAIQSTQSQVSVAMMKKTLDMQEAVGSQLVQMMEQSVNPALGGTIDIHI